MKKMRTIKLIAISLVLFLAGSLQAQISFNVNIGSPPPWGPSGYNNVRYYYLPDVEAYYDINASMFIYFNGHSWLHRSNLPGQYRNYDLYNGYKVVMSDYRGNTPYSHFNEHRAKYAKGYRDHYQKTFKDKPEKRDFRDNHSQANHNRTRNDNIDNKNQKRGNDEGEYRGNHNEKKDKK